MTQPARGPRRPAHASPRTSTATTKLVPPVTPSSLLRRERLLDRLDDVLERRLTTVVAEAGYGKSTLLADWAAGVECAWYTVTPDDATLGTFARGIADALRLRVPTLPADAAAAVTAVSGPGAEHDEPARARGFAALVCESLQSELGRDLVLVLDDVHDVVAADGAMQLVDALCRQAPASLHVVLSSRTELPFPIERLRGQGHVLEIAGVDLAFDVEETRALLAAVTGDDDAETAAALHAATGGWPAAVRLAVETLRDTPPERRAAALERIRKPGGALFAYLATEVFAHEAPEVERLVRLVAPLERFNAELCEALGLAGAGEILGSLARRGLFVEVYGLGAGWYALGAAIREFAQTGTDEAETRRVLLRAARWFEAHDRPEEALRSYVSARDAPEVVRTLHTHGPLLLAHGSIDPILEAVALLPADLRDTRIEQLAGEALQVRGRWDEALRCFERASEGADPMPAALAWRIGLLHHLNGALDEAMLTYHRADEDGDPADVALLLAWRASAHWLRAETEECRVDAERAHERALAAGDPQALAAAHTVLAMVAALEGDRGANDTHYLRALDYAQEAGDALQLIRVRTNRGSRHLEEGAYEAAIDELDLALRLADLAGFAAFRALALTNRGEAHAKLARFEEAVADLEAARELYQRLGTRMIAYPLEKLGEVYRERGDWALARAAYEEALARAPAGDLQGLVPTLSGLARVVLTEDPEEARTIADEAVALGPAMGHVHALLTSGWVALAQGDRALAHDRAVEAAAAAGVRRDRAALAESLELHALAAPEPAAQIDRLREAEAIWRELSSPLGEARAALVTAHLTGDPGEAARAEGRLQALGARGYRSLLSRVLPADDDARVSIQSLGRFRVLRGGQAVPQAAWQSRKARDLLKILVARRGRPTPRDVLMDALWPDESPEPLGNRLSVLLSTVRGVLDPEKRHDPDRFVGADRGAIWLQSESLELDVERFLTAATDALARRRSKEDGARERLAAAEAAYSGDFLEEDAYEEWALALREEARTTYIEVVRALADDAAAEGDADAATRYYLRVLERDPYDEPAHLGLVSALEFGGRHGEARRAYHAYCARMDTIGVESAPFPAR